MRASHIIGRSRRADLQIDDARISSQHAEIRWTAAGWELSDLGSRNGTYVGDEEISRVTLAVGDLIGFGRSDDPWRFDSAEPPVAMAEPVHADSSPVLAVGELLALPHDSDHALCIYRGSDGRWVQELGSERSPVQDGAELVIDGQMWRLHLPELVNQTEQTPPSGRDMGDLRLEFQVSRDEEDVWARIHTASETFDLGSRAHHYTLLTLARLRARDRENPDLPITSHGWIHVADLATMLRIREKRVNVDIYRARRQLAALGIDNPTRIVERRNYRRQLRLGIPDVVIETL